MPSVTGVDDDVPQKGYGVLGFSNRTGGFGVFGRDNSGIGVYGNSDSGIAIDGYSVSGIGVEAASVSGPGVVGRSTSGPGVDSASTSGPGVVGSSTDGDGVQGLSYTSDRSGVYGRSTNGCGVYGHSYNYYGVYALSHSVDGHHALYARSTYGYAAFLDGDVYVRGRINKSAVAFKIDHPLDPANKYLYHSSIESLDMKNLYDGVVALDDKGEAEIQLPDWFGALNKDFRYQLTAIGAPGPNLYIAEEISDGATTNYSDSSSSNQNNNNTSSNFKIAGGTSGMKVSWQVTGIRKDPYANAHRIQVEEDKPDKERGYYLHPDLYGPPEEKGISYLLFPKEKHQWLINENKA